MDIGLNVGEDVYITIGQTLDSIKESLDRAKIVYSIPFSTREDTQKQIIVLFIDKCGVELNILDDKVVYIKSTNYGSNTLFDIDNMKTNKASLLRYIISKVAESYNIDSKDIQLDSYDTKSLNVVLKIHKSIQISVVCNGRSMHIHTVKCIR